MTPIAISDAKRQRQGWANGYDIRVLFAQTGAREYAVWAEIVGEPWQGRLPGRDGERVVWRTFTSYEEAERWHAMLVANADECAVGPMVEPVSAY